MLIRLLGDFTNTIWCFDSTILAFCFSRVWTKTLSLEIASLTNHTYLPLHQNDWWNHVTISLNSLSWFIQRGDFMTTCYTSRNQTLSNFVPQRILFNSYKGIMVFLTYIFHCFIWGIKSGNFLLSTHLKEIPSYPAVAYGNLQAFGFTHCFGEFKGSDWTTCSL